MRYLEKRPLIMIVIGIIGISISSILIRYSDAPSAVTAAWRLLWTVLLMTPVTLGKSANRREMGAMGRKNLLLSIASGLFLALHFYTWFEALKHTTVASAATIVCTEVLWVSLGYWLFMKGRLSIWAMLAIGVSLAGSVLVALSDSGEGKGQLYGDMLALAAAIAAGGYTLLGRSVRRQISTTVYTYVVYGICGAVLTAAAFIQGNSLFAFGLNPVLIGLALAVFSTIMGHSIFSWCLKYFSPSFVSASKLCEPVIASILAVILFGEIPEWLQVLGAAMILGGVIWYSRIESNDVSRMKKSGECKP